MFEPAPGVFPELSPVPATPGTQQPVAPFGPRPGVFPGLAPAPPRQPIPPEPAPGLPRQNAAEQPGAPALLLPPPPLAPGYLPGAPGVPIEPLPFNFPAQTPPSAVALPPVQPGALPIQANDLRAPPILIKPSLSLFAGYTDNPRGTPSTLSDVFTRLNAGTAMSFDSVRLQGQLNGSINYQKYARATEQDTLNANLLAFGLGTLVRDHLFIDGRAEVTQLSGSGGFGFASPTLIPPGQQTQAILFSVTPIARETVGDLLVGEFRYNYSISMFNNGGFLNTATQSTPSAPPPLPVLTNTTQNDATLTIATGPRFAVLGSKLTVNANRTDSPITGTSSVPSAAASNQFRAFDDLQYEINPHFAALGRFGYENLRYPGQSTASHAGILYSIGGRYTPSAASYLELRYSREEGINGINGSLSYQVTPLTTITASLDHSRTTTQQQLLNNLNVAQLNANGILVNRFTGVPIALTNLETPLLASNVYKTDNLTIGATSVIGRNTYSAYAFLTDQTALGPPPGTSGIAAALAGNNTSWGINLNWARSLRQNLTSSVSVGYSGQQIGHGNTFTADALLSYTVSERLTASLRYQFIDFGTNLTAGSNFGSYRRNQIEIGVTRSF